MCYIKRITEIIPFSTEVEPPKDQVFTNGMLGETVCPASKTSPETLFLQPTLWNMGSASSDSKWVMSER